MYNFKLGRYVRLPAGGHISNTEHVCLSNCILELLNIGEFYELCKRKFIFFSFFFFYCGSEILKRMVSILLKEWKY